MRTCRSRSGQKKSSAAGRCHREGPALSAQVIGEEYEAAVVEQSSRERCAQRGGRPDRSWRASWRWARGAAISRPPRTTAGTAGRGRRRRPIRRVFRACIRCGGRRSSSGQRAGGKNRRDARRQGDRRGGRIGMSGREGGRARGTAATARWLQVWHCIARDSSAPSCLPRSAPQRAILGEPSRGGAPTWRAKAGKRWRTDARRF